MADRLARHFNANYLTVDALCRKLGGVSRSTIYRLKENGDLPDPVRIGSRLFWIENEVDVFFLNRRNKNA